MKLRNWYLTGIEYGKYLVWGVLLDEHPYLDVGTFIHTSTIEKASIDIENKIINVETFSGSHYELPFAFEADGAEKELEDFSLKYNLNCDNIVDIVTEIRQEELISNEKYLNEILNEGELFLEVSGDNCNIAYYKKNNNVITITPMTHVGTFQDSVIISDRNYIDFRFFPMGSRLEIYHWSKNLDKIKVKNVGTKDAVVRGVQSYKCPAGEITEIERADKTPDGLLSPDFVNKK